MYRDFVKRAGRCSICTSVAPVLATPRFRDPALSITGHPGNRPVPGNGGNLRAAPGLYKRGGHAIRRGRPKAQSQVSEATGIDPLGPFVLGGKIDKPDPARVPLRGDLAHIGLAGRYFVPHYAEPEPRHIGLAGANLLAECHAEALVREHLVAGSPFDVLDVSRGYAWGCVSIDGPVGYVLLEHLAPESR